MTDAQVEARLFQQVGRNVTVRPWTSGASFPGDASCDSHDA